MHQKHGLRNCSRTRHFRSTTPSMYRLSSHRSPSYSTLPSAVAQTANSLLDWHVAGREPPGPRSTFKFCGGRWGASGMVGGGYSGITSSAGSTSEG